MLARRRSRLRAPSPVQSSLRAGKSGRSRADSAAVAARSPGSTAPGQVEKAHHDVRARRSTAEKPGVGAVEVRVGSDGPPVPRRPRRRPLEDRAALVGVGGRDAGHHEQGAPGDGDSNRWRAPPRPRRLRFRGSVRSRRDALGVSGERERAREPATSHPPEPPVSRATRRRPSRPGRRRRRERRSQGPLSRRPQAPSLGPAARRCVPPSRVARRSSREVGVTETHPHPGEDEHHRGAAELEPALVGAPPDAGAGRRPGGWTRR